MNNFTKEQQLAIDLEGSNIMVSAGAGSGKTTVLKTRVLRELKKENVNINNLIILTFTNNAANEMKERIRKIILENEDLKDDAELLDLAYITTFDSFTGSLVRKYSYLLNMSPNFNIVDSNIVDLETDKILDEILDKYYQDNNEKFNNFIRDYCIKNDTDIRVSFKKLYHNLCSLLNKDEYLNNYVENNYNKNAVETLFLEYENYVLEYVTEYIELLEELENYSTAETIIQNNNLKMALENISTYDEIAQANLLSTIRYSEKAYNEEAKEIKNKISIIKSQISKLTKDSKKTMIDNYMLTKNNIEIIIDIIKELDLKVKEFKDKNNSYEFNDIAFKAIELIEKNEDVRNNLKNNTYEIMIDEYQDTNDIQEKFISLIENNNVYMVGDIKQSIYRFRNANPYIFKNKYDKYKDKNGGVKIDLNKNFRSRNEVIDNINLIFSNIMTDKIGGANYKQEHQMIFGKENYNKNILNDDYNILIYNYDNEIYKNPIYEASIIADDILKRINNHEMVTFEENNIMYSREISYKDFVILVDKSSNFAVLKKVLEGKKIPTAICKDIDIKDEDEIYILKNIINLTIKIKNNMLDNNFKHYFLSIARSFLFKMDDNELYDIVKNNKYNSTELYNIASSLIPELDGLSNRQILNLIVEKFDFINKLVTTGDIEERLTKIEYLINNANDLNEFGFDIYNLSSYLENIINSDNDIKLVAAKNTDSNVVKIMTIHSSKGLEYPYVYMPYLNSSFKGKAIVDKFYFLNNKIILPFNNNGLGDTFVSVTAKHKENIETISEKIRLFYVGLTRAKEKVILISSINNLEIDNPTDKELAKISNYNNLLSLIYNKISKYIYNIENIDFDINTIYEQNYKSYIKNSNEVINVRELKIENKKIDKKHFSKALKKVLNKDIKERLDFGTYMHYAFETFDFKNGDLDNFPITDEYKSYIRNFLSHDEVKDINNAKIHKEQAIYFKKDNNTYNGIIDLMLVYDDHIDIIDYKLSNLSSEEYVKQLNGYKEYIENKYHKETNIYLYSIMKNIFKKL